MQSMESFTDERQRLTGLADAAGKLAAADGILLDWDGCTAIANQPHAAALAFIHAYRDRIAIVSNNTTHFPEEIAVILDQAGVTIPPRRIVLAGTEALKSASGAAARGTLVLSDGRMKAYAHRLGLALVQKNADLVVLLRDIRFSYRKLERAANALRAGARLIVANPDVTHPGPNGTIIPETGSLLAAIAACVDLSSIDVQVIGKPAPYLFHTACAALGIAPARAVMIGDNPATDIAGAQQLGLPAILVSPGTDLLLADLAEATRPHRLSQASRVHR